MCHRKSLLGIRLAGEAQEGALVFSHVLLVWRLKVGRFSGFPPSVKALLDMDDQKPLVILGECWGILGYPQQHVGGWPKAQNCFTGCRSGILGARPMEQSARTDQGLLGGRL